MQNSSVANEYANLECRTYTQGERERERGTRKRARAHKSTVC